MGKRETPVQTAILLYLKFCPSVYMWRNNNGAMKLKNGNFVEFGKPGVSDIIGFSKTGRFIAIEAKGKGGKESDKQKEFGDIVRSMGGLYILAYSVDDVINAFKLEGVIK